MAEAQNDKTRQLEADDATRQTPATLVMSNGAQENTVHEPTKKHRQQQLQRDSISQRDKELVWYNLILGNANIRELASILQHKESTLRSIFYAMRKRQQRGENPLGPAAHGPVIPKPRRTRTFSDDHLLWASRQMAMDNTLTYVDLMTMMQKQFPELQQLDPVSSAEMLKQWMHDYLGLRAADLYPVPGSRNSVKNIEARFEYAALMSTEKRQAYDEAIFVHETRFSYDALPRKGISLRGCRPVIPVGKVFLPVITTIAAMNRTRIVYFECFVGNVSGKTYAGFLQNMFEELASKGEYPRKDGTRQLIIQDSCSIRKSHVVQSVIPQEVELSHLPPYSPFLDPCEEIFSIWKYHFSKLLLTHIPHSKENIVYLICESYFKITTAQVQVAWGRALSFFEESLSRQSISSRRLLDHVHAGDDGETAAISKFKEWGLEHRPGVLTEDVEAGVEADEVVPDPVHDEAEEKLPFASLHDTRLCPSDQVRRDTAVAFGDDHIASDIDDADD
eukprot:ANDGO_06177.mRNA.1 hypothetical protein